MMRSTLCLGLARARKSESLKPRDQGAAGYTKAQSRSTLVAAALRQRVEKSLAFPGVDGFFTLLRPASATVEGGWIGAPEPVDRYVFSANYAVSRLSTPTS